MAAGTHQLAAAERLLDDFRWATEHGKLCPNRVWAVAGKDLHQALPPREKLNECIKSMEQPEQENIDEWMRNAQKPSAAAESHRTCTFDFCEHSVRDYTGVHQRHECPPSIFKKDCSPLKGLFPRSTLTKAAIDGKSTVWSLDGHSLLDRSRPYMAISHVWSDGTGAGQWPNGEVNECLYRYFQRIAVQFQCEGFWWDSVCIPSETAARAKAIKQIHGNYETARITLVHDCFLRNWKWDRETACFAILISPWFSRGWTALELARSCKVKVIFKGPAGPIFKDLDEEILAKPTDSASLQTASNLIRRLREGIKSVNDLLKILGPRSTSWPKDRPIISALLADVRFPLSGGQQAIYKKILTDIQHPHIHQAQIFHNSSTTSEGSWCPSDIYSLPTIDAPEGAHATYRLSVEKDLSLVGTWNCLSVKEISDETVYDWRGTHPFIKEKVEHHLRVEWHRDESSSFLLFETDGSADRAILVEGTSHDEEGSYLDSSSALRCYQYVGAVFFRRAQNLEKGEIAAIRLLGDVDSPNTMVGNPAPKDTELGNMHDAIWRKDHQRFVECKRQRFDLESIWNERSAFQLSKYVPPADMTKIRLAHGSALPDYVKTSDGETVRADEEIIYERLESRLQSAIDKQDRKQFTDYLKLILLDVPDELGQRPLHLAAERGEESMVKNLLKELPDRQDLRQMTLNVRCNAGQTALHRASWGGSEAIVLILLEKGADATIQDKDGNTALHLAVEKGYEGISNLLIDKCDAQMKNLNMVTPLHLAASSGLESIIKRLLNEGADAKVEDRDGWVPLHYAAATGQRAASRLLHRGNEAFSMRDKIVGWTPLHFAAINNHSHILQELCRKDEDVLVSDHYDWSPKMFAIMKNQTTLSWARWRDRLDEKINVPTSFHCIALSEQQISPLTLLDQDFEEHFHKRSSPLDVDEHGKRWSALSWAAKTGHLEFAKWLCSNSLFDHQSRPLYIAAENGAASIVELLFDKGNYTAHSDYHEPGEALCGAAKNGHEAVVELLVAKCEGVRSSCSRALSIAAENEHPEVVALLVASPWVSDDDWLTGVINAASKSRNATLEQLLALDKFDHQEVMWKAVQSGHPEVLDWLYGWLADRFKAPHQMCHDLMIKAAGTGLLTELEMLIPCSKEKGLWSRDWKWTILSALETRQVDLVEYLLDLGSERVKSNIKCQTVRQANNLSHAEMVRVVIDILGEGEIIEDDLCKDVLEEAYMAVSPVARGLLEWMIVHLDADHCECILEPLVKKQPNYKEVLEWIDNVKTGTENGRRIVLSANDLAETLDWLFGDEDLDRGE